MKRWAGRFLGVALLVSACVRCPSGAGQAPDRTRTADHFDRTIAPLLAARCLDCHGGSKPRGGLNLSRRQSAREGGESGRAIVPGNAAASLLWKHVRAGKMPPKKPLTAEEKALLKGWIDGGAAWGTDPIDPFRFTSSSRGGYDWWSLQPVVRPAPPKVQGPAWARNGVDLFILAKLQEKGLAPSPEADRPTLIRRLTFDLTGLPPTPEEVTAFVQDRRPDAYERLVDRLLASPRYGERWARHWLDVARFGESNGFEFDELRRNAWPYRDWVIQALNRDLPFDEFARLQLAGDVLRPGDPQGVSATGFLVAGSYDTVGQQQQSKAMKAVVRQDELEDVVGTVGQAFLGLTVQCARCHDHKFDPVRQEEYYRLTAALGGVRHGERDITPPAVRNDFAARQERRRAELARLLRELEELDAPVRRRILVERKKSPRPASGLPEPLARWDFTRGLEDARGGLHARLHGDARRERTGLVVGGKEGYASTPLLKKSVQARTLAARVRLANLTQRGGGVVSLQTIDGKVFDAIVFGERQPGHWMAGSEFFNRTRPFQGPPETTADKVAVHLALVYAADGTITAYRNGQPYGKPYRAAGPLTFQAGRSLLVFGVRHAPAQPGRMLAGIILEAELYDRALTAPEVATLATGRADYVAEQDLVARLDGDSKARRAKLTTLIEQAQKDIAAPPLRRLVHAVVPRPPGEARVLLRGNPARKGKAVTPGGVAALGGKPDFGLTGESGDAERRRKLAEWVTRPSNPLFARVIVNRLWHHHFGTGLVDTPNDLGFNGGRPSHPQLLDWLADELVRRQFSLKALHRLLVTSATYRQASRWSPVAAKVDAGNRLLWRQSPRRLEAEGVRDAMLAVAGQLNPVMGGPGFQDFQVTVRGATYLYAPDDRDGPEVRRRTVYRTWARSGRSPLLDALDCPDPSTATHRRSVTTTPLQALTLLNSAFVLRRAEGFAARARQEAGSDVRRQIERAYRLAYGRPPTGEEVVAAEPVVRAHGLRILCRALFNSNEFLYVD
jgi:hypothetical protein